MNNLQVEFNKLKKQILKTCRKKHGKQVTVCINIGGCTSHMQCNIHVWSNNTIITSYYPDTVLTKQVVQYIRHNDGQ